MDFQILYIILHTSQIIKFAASLFQLSHQYAPEMALEFENIKQEAEKRRQHKHRVEQGYIPIVV